MQYLIQPFKHQLAAINFSLSVRDLALFWEMGTGKTACAINILRHKFIALGMQRTLILAPLVVLQNWKVEFSMHSKIKPQDIVVLGQNGRKRIQVFVAEVKNRNCIAVTNYEALLNGEFNALIREWSPRILVCDESHYTKNYKSKRSQVVAEIADKTLHNYILTGTPILNNPMDLYMQYRILDRGASFGTNYFAFRARYCEDQNALWSGRPNYFPKWEFNPAKAAEVNTIIFRKAIRVVKADCLDLPPLVKVTYEVELSAEQKRLYTEMKRDFVAWIKIQTKEGEKSVASVATLAMTKALRLQQIVTGLLRAEGGVDVTLTDIPRLLAVENLLADLTIEHKVIVWCTFKHEYIQLANVCKKIGVGHELLTGEQDGKGKDRAVQTFRDTRDCRVLIANRRAGGIGINLVEAAYSIVYSRTFSLGDELQSEARNYRSGSERHASITKINLCARGTIDEIILKRLEAKQEISANIIDLIKELEDE